jgi:hypothetical protein
LIEKQPIDDEAELEFSLPDASSIFGPLDQPRSHRW